ncbi:MAG: cation diffusion facilitator family transporter [Bacteroidales bacterium]|nr:cation diffusion facilitator family transporter [Bacteroidales bacterium]
MTRKQEISRVTWIGMAINAVLTAFKLVAGFVGRSSAMVADGVHSLSDFISDIIILIFLKISSRGRDKDHDFGHGKFETMATFILSLVLLVVAAEILSGGISKIRAVLAGETIATPSMIALLAAAVSIAAKEFCYWITVRVGRRVNSPAVVANAWHHRSDALSSIGSLIGIGAAIVLGNKWVILDPIMGCAISIAIFVVAVRMALPAMKELLDVALPEETENDIIRIASEVEGVSTIHSLKTRRHGPSIIIDAHIMVDHNLSIVEAHRIATKVEERLSGTYGAGTQISIHIEPDNYSHENHE